MPHTAGAGGTVEMTSRKQGKAMDAFSGVIHMGRTLTYRNLLVALAAALTLAAAMGTRAADAPPAAPAAAPAAAAETPDAAGSAATEEEQIQELDEILVRGENLRKQIYDAEDTFYDLYNKLNKDDDYDTNCVYLQLDPTSQIKHRVCIPGFVADAMADWAAFKVRCQPPTEGTDEFACLDKNRNNRLSMNEAAARPELEFDFNTLDENKDMNIDRNEFMNQTLSSPAAYQPPPPQLVLMEGSEKWYRHAMKVINSDPRLAEQAGRLDELYRELTAVQRRFVKLEEDNLPEPTTRRELGPRSQ